MERSFSEKESAIMKTIAINDRNLAKMLFNFECSYCRLKSGSHER
jgi:hypothetical protein